MSHRPPPSPADQALADAATARGVNITARQVERWRQHGWLPQRTRHGLGRGKGSISDPDPPQALGQAMAIRQLLRTREKAEYIPAALFNLGFDLDEQVVKSSYQVLLADALTAVRKESEKSRRDWNHAADEADAAAQALSRRKGSSTRRLWSRRLAEAGRRTKLVEAVSAMLTTVYAGEQPSREGLSEMLTAAGLTAALDSDVEPERFLQFGDLHKMVTALDTATLADLTRARQERKDILSQASILRIAEPQHPDMDGVDDLSNLSPSESALTILFFLVQSHHDGHQ